MNILWRYSTTPGRLAAPPAEWPSWARIEPAHGRALLVMFAHPQCPCSRASVGELAIIMARTRRTVDAYIFFYAPLNEPGSWVRTGLWDSASAIPGVRVIKDPGGSFARRLGAFTSGQTLLYNQRGKLVFNGGITASRGHSGDNNGRDAILGFLRGELPARNAAPVFGCSLKGEEAL
jgi:hypothetical protein